jgi:hypothetical protein
MFLNRATSWLVMALTVALAGRGRVADQKSFQDATDKAARAKALGNWAEADQSFVEAMTHAAGDRQLETEAALAGALNLERWLTDQPAEINETRRTRMIQWYELTRDQGSEKQKTLACNNLGVYYLKQKDYPKAIAEFGRMENSAEANAVYNYNYGRAHELAKQPKPAVRQYGKALAKDPSFGRAATVAEELIATQRATERVRAARYLLDELLPAKPDPPAPGAPPRAVSPAIGRLLYSLLAKLQSDPDSEALASYSLRYLVRSRADAQRFASVDWPALKAVESNERLVTPLQGLHDLFGESLTKGKTRVVLPSDNVFDWFPMCRTFDRNDQDDRPTARRELARLLKAAGDGFAAQALKAETPDVDSAREALLRYTAAFALDHRYPEAALLAAQIFVGDIGAQLDPNHELLDPFARAVFEEKSSLFFTARTKEELIALSLFHVVLATIYEKRPGPPGTAQTAIFQWDHAIRAENRIRNGPDKEYPPSALLRQRLASAYLADGKPNDAWKYGSEAMRLLVDAKQLNTARQYHGELTAQNSPWKLTDDKRSHLTALLEGGTAVNRLRALADVTGPAPFTLLGMHAGESRQVILFAAALGSKGGITRGTWTPDGKLVDVKHFPPNERAIVCAYKGGKYLHTGTAALDEWAPPRWNPNRITELAGRGARLDVADNGKLTIVRSAKGDLSAWDLESPRALFQRKGPTGILALSADGKHFALVDNRGLTVVDSRSDRIIYELDKDPGSIHSLAFSPDGQWLASGTSTGRVDLRDAAVGKLHKSLTVHTSTVDVLVFSPRHPWLATLSRGDSSVQIWHVNKGQELARLPRNGTPLAAAFSPDGRWLSVSYQSGTSGLIKTWDLSKLAGP